MDYYPGMMEEQDAYEDMMEHNEEMAIGQKDWDIILLAICYREVSLQEILRRSDWSEEQVEYWNKQFSILMEVKKKVLDKIR